MKLVLCGKSWVAVEALVYARDLAALFEVSFDLAVVPSRTDPLTSTWQPSLRETSLSAGVPVFEAIEAAGLGPGDVLLSLEYDAIIRSHELGGARAYNMHFSDLPRFRGCVTSVWPLRLGERVAGVTLHALTPGVDAGPIVDQRLFDLPEFMNAFELYRLYHRHAFELFKLHLQPILDDAVTTRPQDDALASYYDRRSIDFGARELEPLTEGDARTFANYVRSLVFAPYQLPTWRGRPVVRCDVVAWRGETRDSNRVIDDGARVLVRCRDGWVRLEYQRDADRPS